MKRQWDRNTCIQRERFTLKKGFVQINVLENKALHQENGSCFMYLGLTTCAVHVIFQTV